MNSNIVKPEKFDHLQLGYHFAVPLKSSVAAAYQLIIEAHQIS